MTSWKWLTRWRQWVPAASGALALALQAFVLLSLRDQGAAAWARAAFSLAGVGLAALAIAGLRRPGRRVAAALALAASLGLAVGGWALGSTTRRAAAPASQAAIAQEAAGSYARQAQALGTWLAGRSAGLAAARMGGGDLFRALEALPAAWDRQWGSEALPLAAAAWSDGQRIAWTSDLAPLPLSSSDLAAMEAGAGAGPGALVEHRDGWRLRQALALRPGLVLEAQLKLPSADAPWRGTVADVTHAEGVHSQGAGQVEGEGEPAGLVASFRLAGDGSAGGAWPRSRLVAFLQLTWVAALLALALGERSNGGFLVAAWVGRAFLAAADLRQALVGSFPGLEFPAAPGAWSSLLDPAYFATPVAAGWFASAGDALLTALLVAATAWRLRASGARPVAAEARGIGGARQRRVASVLMVALPAGLVAGASLMAWRGLAMIIAENANARLVGPGVAVSYLSFWALHLALLLLALAALGLAAAAVAAARARPARGGANIPGLLAALGAAAAAALVPAWREPAAAAAAVLLVALLWVVPSALARSRGAGRLAWPALLLVAVLWNHDALRHVYDRAERAWLERRAQGLTEADPAWMRYLVHSALVEMQQSDHAWSGEPAPGLWRDEPAWRLYRESALADLAYPCLVEILDREARSASLFAEGFLRDFSYETVSRSPMVTVDGEPAGPDEAVTFQSELRLYSGGQEEVLVAEAPRRSGRGWLRLEAPLRSWRVGTMSAVGGPGTATSPDRYRPRLEVDRPVLLLLADDGGWRGSGPEGFPGAENDARIAALRSGAREWAIVNVDDAEWLCRWSALPGEAARSPGEGFLVGIRRESSMERILDVSRLLLVDALLLVALAALAALPSLRDGRLRLQPGFQEKFLAGYLALGLALLTVVGVSVDRVGYQRVRGEARQQAREGLTTALQQLAGLLADGARELAASGLLDDLPPEGAAAGDLDPALQGVMLFAEDGSLLFDGSRPGDPGATPAGRTEAASLLAAARGAPLVLVGSERGVEAVVAVPVALGALSPAGAHADPGPEAPTGAAATTILDAGELIDAQQDANGGAVEAGTPAAAAAGGAGHGGLVNDGVLLYRQRLDGALMSGLAGILRGEVTLSLDGEPVLASHPGGLFEGARPPLLDPVLMASLFDHPQGAGFVTPSGRPFACDAAQPLPAFQADPEGGLSRRLAPAALGVSFPGREREFAAQRRANVLFLAGLANLILLTALLLAALMSWGLFHPLRVLMGATQSLAGGDFAAPLPAAGRDEVGSLAGAFGAMRSRLQAAQADLAARERFLATVLERVTVGVAVVAPDGGLVVANPAGREILGRFWPGLPAADAARRLRDGLQEAARAEGAGGIHGSTSAELSGDGGRLTLRGALAPLDQAGTGGDLMLVFEDVSEFLATKKLALNAELARQVAHEIKNPLTPIQLSVQLLGQAWQDRHPQLERIVPDTVSRVLEQVDLLRRIASEFSLLGRPDELPLASLDLPGLVTRVALAYRPAGGNGAAGLVRVAPAPPGCPRVLAHEESLLKILGNLAQNSLDAARPGVEADVEVAWELAGDRVRLRWRDNGTGIPADVAGRLFEPYFSTKSKGTGLGLAICRSLADRMGGSLALADRRDAPGAEAVLELRAEVTARD